MRTERDTLAAVKADEWLPPGVEINGVHGAGLRALSALDAEISAHNHAPTLPLRVRTCRAGRDAGRRVAGEAGAGLEAGGQPAGGGDADAGRVP